MDRKDTLVSTENDKDKEELHIRTVLQKCGYPKWIFEKVKQDQMTECRVLLLFFEQHPDCVG